MGNFSEKPQK